MKNFSISLKNRLTLSYALFISLALGVLSLLINLFTGLFFTALIKENIAAKSREIAATIGKQYSPQGTFDTAAVEAMGMYFAREGYIITVEDENDRPIWDARSCDMQCCIDVINDISVRMESLFNLSGALQKERYPVVIGNHNIGTVTVETYGPFFYSETETQFLSSINRLLLIAGIILTGISVIVSAALSRTISKPVLAAGEAAHKIARAFSGGTGTERPVIRIPDRYHTRELAALSSSINALAGKLEEGERRQKQLMSDISHELRTPLTCLRGNIEAMLDGVYACDREQLANCHEEIMRLANLVHDLDTLTILEWETITLNKTEFDLAKLLQATAEQWKPAAHEKGITLNLNTKEFFITADYDRLKQVFINILSNAVKYTDSAASPEGVPTSEGNITISMDKTENAQCKVTVTDTGIGIPEEDLPRIFERFYRSDKSRSRSTGGAGIGLAIAAAIVRAHGGTIEAANGKTGAAFSVVI
jgi:signal transduction histidine kinase